MSSVITTMAGNASLTMSSLEIAELTGKRHDNVVRDIEKMLTNVGEGLLKFEDTYINPQNGQEYRCYKLPQDLTYNLVLGYRDDLRLKVVRRWMELEAEQRPSVPSNMVEALTLALEQQKALEAKEEELKAANNLVVLKEALLSAAQPKAEALDTLASMRGFHSLTQAAKGCSWPRDAFIEECSRIKWIYRDRAKEIWMGYSEKERAGYLDYKPFQYTSSDGKLIKKPQVVFTDKGLAKICEIFAKKEKPVPFTKAPA